MGEIADGLINGDFDFYTGEYIGRGYGIPRTRNKSLAWENRAARASEEKQNAYRAINKFIQKKLGNLTKKEIKNVIDEYRAGEDHFKDKCVEIMKDFSRFANFIHLKLTNKTI